MNVVQLSRKNVGVGGWAAEGPKLRRHLRFLCEQYGIELRQLSARDSARVQGGIGGMTTLALLVWLVLPEATPVWSGRTSAIW